MILLETISVLKTGTLYKRHYMNKKRITEHEFCTIILKHRRGNACKPDEVINGLNRDKTISRKQITRKYWFIGEETHE